MGRKQTIIDTYPPEVAWQRFNALLERMLRSGPPALRTSFRDASGGYSDTQTPLHTSEGASATRERASHGSTASDAPKSPQSQSAARLEFVRMNGATRLDVLGDKRLQSPLSNVRDNVRHHVSVALNHPEYDGLVRRAATAFATGRAPANVGFVGFDLAATAVG